MCCDENPREGCCEKPERLRGGKPQGCTRQRIRECHGEVREHPCPPESQPKKADA